jgi:hypothetical protein
MVRFCESAVAACEKGEWESGRREDGERVEAREGCCCSFDWEARHVVAKPEVWRLGREVRAMRRTEEDVVRIMAAGGGSRARACESPVKGPYNLGSWIAR